MAPKRAKGDAPERVGPGLIRRKDGETLRAFSVYVEPDLYQELAHWAVDHNLKVSTAAVELMKRALREERGGK